MQRNYYDPFGNYNYTQPNGQYPQGNQQVPQGNQQANQCPPAYNQQMPQYPMCNQQMPIFNPQQTQNNVLKENKQKKEIISVGFSLGLGLILSLVIQTIMSLLLAKFNLHTQYFTNSVFFSGFNSFAVSFMSIALPFGIIAFANKNKYVSPIVPIKKNGFWNSFLWIHLGLAACVFANIFVGIVITVAENFGYKLDSPETPGLDSPFACVMLVISTMIMPALCEEFSMRCCAMGLLRKHGKSFAVFAVSIIFGLLHGNVIQFIFAFIVGYILAYITMKTDSIIPAIFIHAFNNGRSVLYDIVEYATSEDTAQIVTYVVTGYMIIMGIVSFIMIMTKGDFKLKDMKNDDDVLPIGKKLLYLLPGLALPLLILTVEVISTISKM